MSISNAMENAILDAILNHTTTGGGLPTVDPFCQLHLGDPGENGTANPAFMTTRMQLSFGAASSGSCSNDTLVSWPTATAAETYTFISLWTASSGGTNLWNGPLNQSAAVAIGGNVQLAIGAATVTLD